MGCCLASVRGPSETVEINASLTDEDYSASFSVSHDGLCLNVKSLYASRNCRVFPVQIKRLDSFVMDLGWKLGWDTE